MTIGGLGWATLATPAHVWSPEQAAEYQAAGAALHAARSEAPPTNARAGHRPVEELAAAQARFTRISAELDRARSQRDRWGLWTAGTGLALIILGGVGYLAARRPR